MNPKNLNVKVLIGSLIEKTLYEELNPKLSFEKMLDMKRKYNEDFWILDTLGKEMYQKILDYREQAEDLDEYRKMVSGMPYTMAVHFWSRKLGGLSSEELSNLKREYETLEKRFRVEDDTDIESKVYGKNSKKVFDTLTGTSFVVDGKKGYLGT